MIKYLTIFTLVLTMSSCSNWRYQNIPYLSCRKFDEIHVHLYHHDSCEWSCLYLKETNGIFVDTVRVKYKLNKKGKLTKLKLLK